MADAKHSPATLEQIVKEVAALMATAEYNDDFDAFIIPAHSVRLLQSYYRGLSGGKKLQIGKPNAKFTSEI